MIVALVALGAGVGAGAGCERVDEGQLVVTWRFNGHAKELGNSPCRGVGADRIVIQLDGPEQASDVVACDNVDPSYPLLWLSYVADLPVQAYGRRLRDVPSGRYDVRVFFIDAEGAELAEPPAATTSITVERAHTARIDLDFPVTTGSVGVRWRIGGDLPAEELCASVDASDVHVSVEPGGGGATVAEATVPCAQRDGVLLPGLAPGDYEVTGQLLDASGAPVTGVIRETGVSVAQADTDSATLHFAWEDFTNDLRGSLRLSLLVDGGSCSDAVAALAHPPLAVRLGLLDAGSQPVVGAVAFANPAGQLDCAGLTPALTADGTSLGACPDAELILCELPAGDYTVSVGALDASDLVCYSAEEALTVAPGSAEAPVDLDLATTDATACWP